MLFDPRNKIKKQSAKCRGASAAKRMMFGRILKDCINANLLLRVPVEIFESGLIFELIMSKL